MAITASEITTANTLEQLRGQFNNLVTDVSGLEAGTSTFTAITATTSTATTVNVAEDGTIVFEGATADAYETTLTVTDPTADRTITLPNETGTVFTSGGAIALGGNITKASDLTVDIEGDISLDANGGEIYLKDNGTIFATFSQNGGNLTIKNSSAEEAAITIAGDEVVTLADDLIIKDGGTIGVTSAASAMTIASTGIVTFVDDILIKDAGTIGSATSTGAITIASTGIVTFVDDIVIKDGGTIGTGTTAGAITIAAAGAVTLSSDITVGALLKMPTVTAGYLLVGDGTSYEEVAVSGDVTMASGGAVTIAANAVEGSMLNTDTISAQTALTSGLETTDELLVSDAGTLKRMDVSVLSTLTDGNATALAIALG